MTIKVVETGGDIQSLSGFENGYGLHTPPLGLSRSKKGTMTISRDTAFSRFGLENCELMMMMMVVLCWKRKSRRIL